MSTLPKLQYIAKEAKVESLEYIMLKDKVATACDAHVLIEFPLVDAFEGVEGFIHYENWKEISKAGCHYYKVSEDGSELMAYSKTNTREPKAVAPIVRGINYPKIESVKPRDNERATIDGVGISLDKVYNLYRVFRGATWIDMDFCGSSHIRVCPFEVKDGSEVIATGLLCPRRLDKPSVISNFRKK